MKVLVTGARGFIGRTVAKAMLERGHEVSGVSRSSDWSGAAIEMHAVDLLDPPAVEALLKRVRPEGLVHLAWDTSHGSYWSTPENLRWTGASLFLLESFVRHGGKRVVVAGTSAEYRWDGEADLSERDTPLDPSSLYGVSKNALREIVETWALECGLSWGWGRIFCPFGPHEAEMRLIPKLIRRILSGEKIEFDSGSLVRDFLHVEDLGDAFAALFDSPVHGPVNLASGQGVNIRELLTLVATSLECPEQILFDALPDPVDQPHRVVAEVTRLWEEVGWRPQAGLAERLDQTCCWWKERLPEMATNPNA